MDRKEVTLYDLKVALDAHEARCLEDKTEMKNDIKLLQGDVNILQNDVKILKDDTSYLKCNFALMQRDLKHLKETVGYILVEMREMRGDLRDLRKGDVRIAAYGVASAALIATIGWVVSLFVT